MLKFVSLCAWNLYIKRTVLDDQVLMVQNYNHQRGISVLYNFELPLMLLSMSTTRFNLRAIIKEA